MGRKGMFIYKVYLDDDKLNWNEKVLMSEILSIENQGRVYDRSDGQISKFLFLKTDSAGGKIINKLKSKGYVSIMSKERECRMVALEKFFKVKPGENQGIWIYLNYLNDDKLNWLLKALISKIHYMTELPDGCIMGDKSFGSFCGKSIGYTNKNINKLVSWGYVNKFVENYKGRKLYINYQHPIHRFFEQKKIEKQHLIEPAIASNVSNEQHPIEPLSASNTSNDLHPIEPSSASNTSNDLHPIEPSSASKRSINNGSINSVTNVSRNSGIDSGIKENEPVVKFESKEEYNQRVAMANTGIKAGQFSRMKLEEIKIKISKISPGFRLGILDEITFSSLYIINNELKSRQENELVSPLVKEYIHLRKSLFAK